MKLRQDCLIFVLSNFGVMFLFGDFQDCVYDALRSFFSFIYCLSAVVEFAVDIDF